MLERQLDAKWRDYVPRDTVKNFPGPIIIAGEADVRVLPAQAREVLGQANEPKTWWLIPGAARTNSLTPASARYWSSACSPSPIAR